MKSNLDFPDNVSLNFNAHGVEIRVSLNIPASLKPYLSMNNVHKGNTHWVYAIKTQLPSAYIEKNTIIGIKNDLMLRAMSNIRRAKSKQYQSKSDKLYHQLTIFENDY